MSRFVSFNTTKNVQKFGGKRQSSSAGCFFYGGPEKQRRLDVNAPTPTFEELAKNRVLEERRFYLNNSNTKYISMGIVPSTKILSPEAPGFIFEAFLAGEKAAPLPLGGVDGLGTLFATLREIPPFSRMPAIDHEVRNGEHIEISTVEFAKNVYKIENTAHDGKIFIAENGLYLLLKNVGILMSIAKAYNPEACEAKFNSMLDAAIADYPIFLANIARTSSSIESDVIVNFDELFNVLLDIKKKIAQEAATAQADQTVQPAAVTAPPVIPSMAGPTTPAIQPVAAPAAPIIPPVAERTQGKNKKK